MRCVHLDASVLALKLYKFSQLLILIIDLTQIKFFPVYPDLFFTNLRSNL